MPKVEDMTRISDLNIKAAPRAVNAYFKLGFKRIEKFIENSLLENLRIEGIEKFLVIFLIKKILIILDKRWLKNQDMPREITPYPPRRKRYERSRFKTIAVLRTPLSEIIFPVPKRIALFDAVRICIYMPKIKNI